MIRPSRFCRLAGFFAFYLVATPVSSRSQGIRVDPVPIGVRQPARFFDEVPGAVLATIAGGPEVIKNSYSLTPSFTAVDGASIYSGAVSWTHKGRALPFQLVAGANAIDGRSGTKKSASLAAVLLRAVDSVATFALRAAVQRTFEVATQQTYQLAGDFPIRQLKQAISIGGTAAYTISDPDEGDRRTGPVLATGLTWGVSELGEIDIDYQFKTDIVGEDDFSITAMQILADVPRQPKLILVGGKHRTLSVSVVIPLFTR